MSAPIAPQPAAAAYPPAVAAYLSTGKAPSTVRRDLTTAMNQVPTWGYGLLSLVSVWMAARSYNAWRKTP